MKKAVLRFLGVVALLVAMAALARDIFDPDVPPGTAAAQAGFQVGQVIGMGLRSVLLVGIAVALFDASNKSKRDSQRRSQFPQIVDAHRSEVPTSKPKSADLYSSASDEDLAEMFARIDRRTNPEHFAALLWMIAQRSPSRPAVGVDAESKQ
jgi:hypothetical protein